MLPANRFTVGVASSALQIAAHIFPSLLWCLAGDDTIRGLHKNCFAATVHSFNFKGTNHFSHK